MQSQGGKNDVCKKLYFSSNRHDPAAEILVARQKLEMLSSHKRRKRKYTKQDEEYWSEGIREQRKICRRSNHTTPILSSVSTFSAGTTST